MGHYDTCREGYCGWCGQVEDEEGKCLSKWCKEHQSTLNSKLKSNKSRQYIHQMKNKEKGLCIHCKEPRVNSTYCEKHRIKHNLHMNANYQRKTQEKKMNNVQLSLSKENNMSDYANVLRLITKITELEQRVNKLESPTSTYKDKSTKEKKVPTQIGNYLPYILEVLNNGKAWAVHAIEEEIKLLHPELPSPKFTSLAKAANVASKAGKIKKVANNIYRKIETQ